MDEQKPYIRRGKVIVSPEGQPHDYGSINRAKKASVELQRQGHAVRAEKIQAQPRRVFKARKPEKKPAPKAQRFSPLQVAKFSRNLTQDELDEIARKMHGQS